MKQRTLLAVFFASFFFSIHSALVSYINSSMLETHVSASVVSTLFALGSAISIVLTLSLPHIMRKIGVVRSAIGLFVLSTTLLTILGTAMTPKVILAAFVLYFALNACILYVLDIFVEHYSSDTNTGKIRGLFLTINNLGWVGMPALAGIVAAQYGFNSIYLLAGIGVTLTALFIALSQRNYKEVHSDTPPALGKAIKHVLQTPALRRVITINFLLQFFFSWMVIYSPLYLSHTLGFSWETIGLILSIMLVPYVLFQYPAGRIADKWLGEKELIILGFIIMAVSTCAFGILKAPTVVMVSVLLFGTRVGASILEVMADSYFFKHIDETDTSIIGFYRITQPFAYILGPVLGAIALIWMSYATLFVILSGIMVLGGLYALRLVDTR